MKISPKFFSLLLVFFVLIYIPSLLEYGFFEDESETIVTAKMMASGELLYSEIFNHHGPLTFLPGYILNHFGNFGIITHRVMMIFGLLLALVSIYKSPIVEDCCKKITYCVVCAFFLLVCFPKFDIHLYMYQSLAAICLIISLSLFIFPSLLKVDIKKKNVILGTISLGSLPFFAITYLPLVFCFLIASLQKKYLKLVTVSLLLTFALNILFLLAVGSFNGYVVDHFYMNFFILPDFMGLKTPLDMIQSIMFFIFDHKYRILFLLVFVSSLLYLWKIENVHYGRVLLIGLGASSLLVRPADFQQLPYYCCVVVCLGVFLRRVKISFRLAALTGVLLIVFPITFRIYSLNFSDKSKTYIPQSSTFASLVKIMATPEQKILSYNFDNTQYILAERLPASGYFFYLPWQAKYNENPKLGIEINPAKDIIKNQPIMVYSSGWKVWGIYEWESYAGEINDLLFKRYRQMTSHPEIYFAKDKVTFFSENNLTPTKKIVLKNKDTHQFALPVFKDIEAIYLKIINGSGQKQFLDLQFMKSDESVVTRTVCVEKNNSNDFIKIELPSARYHLIKITPRNSLVPIEIEVKSTQKTINKLCAVFEFNDGTFGLDSTCNF